MDELKLKSEIVKASQAVRTKYRALKRGLAEEETEAEKRYKPLLAPLEKIIDLTAEKEDEKPGPTFFPKKLSARKVKKIGTKKIKPIKPRGTKIRHSAEKEEKEEENEHEATKFYDPEEEEIFENSPLDDSEHKSWAQFQEYLKQFGPLTKAYLTSKFTENESKFDETFGVRPNLKDDTWWIGSKQINFDNEDFIYINGAERPIKGTRGLFELLFKKLPDPSIYNESDKQKYKSILILTNAHKQGYNEYAKIASSHGKKYNSVISDLFKTSGKGLLPVTDNKIDYVHWDDPNELVERLALLIASKRAGHSGHEREIASIEEELREANFIE